MKILIKISATNWNTNVSNEHVVELDMDKPSTRAIAAKPEKKEAKKPVARRLSFRDYYVDSDNEDVQETQPLV